MWGITGNIDGAISASLTSSIKNCINDGDISLSNSPDFTADTLYIGGMTGNFAPEHGKITDCTNNGAVTIRSAYAAMQIGGIAGNASKATQEIRGCVNNGDIISYDKNGSYHRNVGGIVGCFALDAAGSKVVDCTNYGDLTRDQVVGNAYLGGIVASTKNIAFVNVKNYGVLTMTTVAEGYSTDAVRYVGGIAGYANVSSISGAVNEGEVNCSGGANIWKVGGVAGSITAVKLDDATNRGNVTVTNKAKANIYYVGGIVGDVTSGTTWINNSENYGDVTVDVEIVNGASWLGGIVGFLIGASTMKNDANYGDIYASKTATHYHGGLVGGLNISGNTDVYDRNDSSTVAEMKDLYNEGSVDGVGSTSNAAYGGIVGRASNDNGRDNLPVHDIVNAINIGAVKNGSLSGGIIGYNASSRKKVQSTDTVETAMRYTINLRECIALNTNGTYGLIGCVSNAFVNISDCFTDAKDYTTYRNQDTLYNGGTGATINGILYPEHYNQGTIKLNPTGITYVEIETMDKASVRLDAFGTDESGIRFDSAISKQTYDALKAAQDAGKLTFEFGTLIAPTDNLNLAKVVAQYDKAAALDALTKPGSKMYTLVPYNQDFLSEDADNYYFAGALNHIKEKNYNLKFTAIAYLTVAVGDIEFTFWADYDDTNTERARSIAQVAGMAFEDRATEKTVIDGYDYRFNAIAENECYLGNWSLYSNSQLELLKKWSNYNDDGKVAPEGLSVNGVSISEYKIVYAQSPIYKYYGSDSGKTLWGDLGNFSVDQYVAEHTVSSSGSKVYTYEPMGTTHFYGDTLLGARYDYDYQTAIRLQQLIAAKYGITLEVVPDYDIGADASVTDDDVITPETPYEILVGYTNRAKSQSAALARMGDDDYTLKIEDTAIIVCGGAYGTTWHAVDALEALFATLDSEADYNLKMAGNLSGTYDMMKIATIGDSITRGSQSLPDGNDYGGPGGAHGQFGWNAVEIYFRNFLSYPANLQRLMWKEGVVYNFGRGASTAINLGNSNYYGGSTEWNDCKATMKTVAFDLVFMQHGTNDSGSVAKDSAKETDYYNEIKALMDEFLTSSNPDCKFVMNSVPHAFDGTYATRGEAADENMRRVQKETATALKALGYDVYHFNMGEYTRINLINEGAAACPGHTVTDDYREEEIAIHSDYYNINTGTQRNEGTHPNYRGYNKMADGVYEVVLYVLKDGAKPALMIDIQ